MRNSALVAAVPASRSAGSRPVTAERDAATAATSALLRIQGAAVFRVHNVAINRDALAVADAMLAVRDELERKGMA